MTSGVSFQAGETTKLLKAFDRWAATGRWALTGNQSVKANIQGVQSEVEKQTKKLETNLSRGFDSIGRHLREMVRLLEERAQNAAAPDAVGDAGGSCRNSSHTRNGQGLLGLQIREDQHHPDLPLPQQFHHLRQSQCHSLWRSVRNSRTGRDQILPFRSQHRASVWASLPEMRERVYRGHCHRRHTVLNKPAESPVSGLPRDWGWFVMGTLSSGGFTENVKIRDIDYWELREARPLLLGGTHDVYSFLNFLQPVR